MTGVQSVSLIDDKVIMMITDEVEVVGRAKVCRALTHLYTKLCMNRVFETFRCEGCENDWPSQRDHECCIRSEEDIFHSHYDVIKNEVNLETLCEVCEQFLRLVDQPMTQEWSDFILNLPNRSATSVYSFWQEMDHTWDTNDFVIMDFVNMMCQTMQNKEAWDSDIYQNFVSFMMDE